MKEFKLLLAALCFGVLPFAAIGCGDDEAACDEGFESDGDGGCIEVGAAEGTEDGGTGAEGAEGEECTPQCEGKCGGDDGCEGTCTADSPGALKCAGVQSCNAEGTGCQVACVNTGKCAGGNQGCPGKYDFCTAVAGECKPVTCAGDADCLGLETCDKGGAASGRKFGCDLATKQCVSK